MARSPLFLERRSYRLRRMMDAVRLLPVLGLALWMVPLLWPVSLPDLAQATSAQTELVQAELVQAELVQAGDAMPMSTALRYLFGVWALLVLSTWALWRRTRDAGQATADSQVVPE